MQASLASYTEIIPLHAILLDYVELTQPSFPLLPRPGLP